MTQDGAPAGPAHGGPAKRDRATAANRELAALDAEAQRLGAPLDERARGAFALYLDLLIEWTPRAGLTSVTDPVEVQRRHFGESLALLVALRGAGMLGSGATSVVDIGAGAGLPGVPMRITEPALRLTLIESNGKRARFLEALVEALDLDGVAVVNARAEEAGRDPALRAAFDVAVSRAVAPLPVLVEYALPLLRRGGVLATPKGSRATADLQRAARAIEALGSEALPPLALSLPPGAQPQSVLLVRRTGELDDRYPRRPGIPAKRPLG